MEKTNSPLIELDPRRNASHLYWAGYSVGKIAEILNQPAATIHSWKRRDKWDDKSPLSRISATIESQYIRLLLKENKEEKDYRDMSFFLSQMEKVERINRFGEPGSEKRSDKRKQKPERNHFTEEQTELLKTAFMDKLFEYQRTWHNAGLQHRIRNILKSRQIGATFYFAREALLDAVINGKNQIFLSASKSQSHVFRNYIVAFAKEIGVELVGDPIVLSNGAELHFLGTNSKTAQSYTGNFYFDEYFWTHNFLELRKVASAIALHSHWRLTYFSTPSSLAHQAYPFWSGALFNKGRPKSEKIDLDLSHKALANGLLCPDGQWRQIVTIEDAVSGGATFFDLQQIRLEYNPEDYQNLLMCQFINDADSVFPLSGLQSCMVDSWETWHDFKPFAIRPFGNNPVWVGYDPANSGDSAGCVVIAPPAKPGGKFRILERHQYRNADFAAQAENIRQITLRYNVTYIGIDATGLGQGVYQLVKQFYPFADPILYTPEVKILMVLKTKDLISKGRLEYDAGHTDITQSFTLIRKTVTASGRNITYTADRTEEASHADLAWAAMHALAHEPLSGVSDTAGSFMEFYK